MIPRNSAANGMKFCFNSLLPSALFTSFSIRSIVKALRTLFSSNEFTTSSASNPNNNPFVFSNAIIAINLSSAFHTTAVALPMMRKAGWGRIVNIASAHGLTASPFKSAYVAAKHGVVGLTKTVALETAEEAITCNAICPGYVLTPLVEAQIPDQMKVHGMDRETVIREVMLTRQPSKQFATVEQLGGTTVFLCSDAAAQITGTTISVDGGWTAL